MIEHAPSAEAKATAVQIRAILFAALEAAIENDWWEVVEQCRSATVLAEHCQKIEASYREEETE